MRMTNLQAAVGLAQLEQLDQFIHIKQKMGLLYTELLNNCDSIKLPPSKTELHQIIIGYMVLYWIPAQD